MGMTIDEAIKHCEEVANRQGECKECADEHRQLAEWLGKLQKIEKIINAPIGGTSAKYNAIVNLIKYSEVNNDNRTS